ncbi:O-methylsterigmatocystin oxidoreductase [Podospora australis]|uniref:O-methylsterigmatocystin oxidoreductase n=1 Tax=Podospora australis TaxID=1536484 RepID=A0AAN6WR07_9PEZI|nr:O-methylsterigmatocystin oxidoreductase [Podospora australis]
MTTYASLPLFAILTTLFLIATFYLRRRDRRTLAAIPGPKSYSPNLLGLGPYQLPPLAPVVFRQWALEYGDVFKIRVGWYDWVVINTPDAVREILEKQSLSTSSKPPSPLGHDVVTGGNRMPTMSYGPRWRCLRTMLRQITTVPMTASFIPSQEFEAKQLLLDLVTQNENQRDFYQHMRRFAFSIIMTNTFGTRVQNWQHPDAQNAVQSQAILRQTSRPGAFIVDELPPLAKLPTWLQPGRKMAEEAAARVLEIKMAQWRRLEKQVEAGQAPHCFAKEIMENKAHWYAQGLTEEQLAWVATGIVEAGFETTAATLNSLVLHLAANQRVQAKAQEELMRVVGPERVPCYADIRELPYVRACVKEMLRMNPILSPGIRHFADEDVVYKNHVIPKGTVLLANTAFLHFDPRRFEDPFEFKPERYLSHALYSSEYAAMSDPYKRDHFTFSSGRRTCPGARLAENSLDIALAGMLWAFEIRPPLVDGKEEAVIDPNDHPYADAGFTIPKPFAARFVPREGREKMIQESWDRAVREGYELRGVHVDVDGMMQ